MKKRKTAIQNVIFLILILIIQLVAPMAAYADTAPTDVPEGSGTQADPYLVDSPEDLMWMSQSFEDQGGFYGEYFLQTGDINMAEYDMVPIGSEYAEFNGHYDGDGKIISDLTMANNGDFMNFGLFGYIGDEGVIQNLIIEDANIAGNGTSLCRLGILSGLNYGKIKHCKITADNGSSLSSTDSAYFGALAGTNCGLISKCTNEATVTASIDNSIVGGIVGDNSGTVINCLNKGPVTAASDGDVAGGIVGMNDYGDIYWCLNTGALASVKAGTIGIYWYGESKENYYLNSTADDGIVTDNSDEGAPFDSCTSESETNLKKMDTFTGWDFNNNWIIDEGNAYPEPRTAIPARTLQAEVAPGTVPGTTSVTLSDTIAEDHSVAVIVTGSNSSYSPDAGDPAPISGRSVIYPYVEGNNISVEANGGGEDRKGGSSGGYLAVFDVNSLGNIEGYKIIKLEESDIKASPVDNSGTWEAVGEAGFAAGEASVYNTSIAFDSKGIPYVSYIDSDSRKITVMKYTGEAWEAVGSPNFSEAEAFDASISIDQSDVPYVIFSDEAQGYKATVMKFTGSAWEAVGSPGFTEGGVSRISFAISPNGTPYAAFRDDDSYQGYVMKYNGVDWETIGGESFTEAEINSTSIAVDPNGVPYVAYVYFSGEESSVVSVSKYTGTEWKTVGSGGFPEESNDPSLTLDKSGIPYVIYADWMLSGKSTVKKYSGGEWVVIGYEGFSKRAEETKIAVNNQGTPYAAFIDNDLEMVSVMRYDNDTSSWIALEKENFSPSYAGDLSFTMSPAGVPYVSFCDGGNNQRVTVMKFVSKHVSPEEPVVQPVSGGSGGSSNNTNTSATVVVNGQSQSAGTQSQTMINGIKNITVEVNKTTISNSIDSILANSGTTDAKENVIEVPVASKEGDTVKVGLTGDLVKKMEDGSFALKVISNNVSYIVPSGDIRISEAAQELGAGDNLGNVEVRVNIIQPTAETVAKLKEQAEAKDYEIVIPPVSFEITAVNTRTNQSMTIDSFNNYVERMFEIPAGVDPSKITTGIVYNNDGTFCHIPTMIIQADGKYYAKLNSLTNSTYFVVWNPVTVASVENHWAREAVSDMAARLVIKNPETFDPNQKITRGEFSEYITKALGLYRTGIAGDGIFNDVKKTDELADAIKTAVDYGIIKGYTDGSFKPNATISRQEAMVMYSRAMSITKLVGTDQNRISKYTDYAAVSNWAKENVKQVIAAKVFNGVSDTKLAPNSTLTTAEAATAIRNLLVQSQLINQ